MKLRLVLLTLALLGTLPTSAAAAAGRPKLEQGFNPTRVSPPPPAPILRDRGPGRPGAGTCEYGACYYWGAMTTYGVQAEGVSVRMLQADPRIGPGDIHSDAELMVLSSDSKSIVEVGWIVGLYSDSLPHLFVYHWVNGAPTCYDGCGFVQTSSQFTAGQVVSAGHAEAFMIRQARQSWQVFYAGAELGYFPDSLWSGTFRSVAEVEAFGEVAAASPTRPLTQMGNGILGTKPNSAFLENLKYLNPTKLNTFNYGSFEAPTVYKVGHYVSACKNGCGMTFGGPGY